MNFGIIGTNFVSDSFMEGAALVDGCNVVAVCSGKRENAEKFAAKYGIDGVYSTYEEMLNEKNIDAVYVATPNSTHRKIAGDCLMAKKHVFCEKPMASNYKEVAELVALARECGVYLHEGLFPLFSDNYKTIKKNLHRVGKIRQVNINMSQYSTRYDAYLEGKNPTTFRLELSNGATMDLGVYTMAIAIDLFGAPKKTLSAATLLDTGVDVSASAIFVYDGFTANLAYSKASDSYNRVEICGEEGVLSFNHPTRTTDITFKSRHSTDTEQLFRPAKPGFYYEIKEMISRIESGKTESESVPLELSLELHNTLTKSRTESGIIYPSDK